MTLKEYYNEVKELAIAAERQDIVDKTEERITSLAKRGSTETKEQKANKVRAEIVYQALASINKPIAVNAFVKACADTLVDDEEGETFSPQRVTALLGKLVTAGRVTRTKEGKVALYSVAVAEA